MNQVTEKDEEEDQQDGEDGRFDKVVAHEAVANFGAHFVVRRAPVEAQTALAATQRAASEQSVEYVGWAAPAGRT